MTENFSTNFYTIREKICDYKELTNVDLVFIASLEKKYLFEIIRIYNINTVNFMEFIKDSNIFK